MAADYLTVPHLATKGIARIFAKIRVNRDTGCWEWIGGRSGAYGKVKIFGRTELVHRLMYAWLVGPLPRGQAADIPNIDHIVCDNKVCCFPAHLAVVKPKANTLRSATNPTAINARKTHCLNGHELPTKPTSYGRECPVCKKVAHRCESFVAWNKSYGHDYHQSRRYGPDREAFLKKQRDYLRAWKLRKKAASNASLIDPKP